MIQVRYDWVRYANDDKEREAITNLVLNSKQLSTLLLKILSDKFEELEDKDMKEEDYAKPELTHRLAYRNGKKAAYKEIAELFTTKEV